jgi:hypothetical protein
MIKKPFLKNRGMAIVAVIVFTFILLILGATFLRLATSERLAADKNFYLNEAFYLAEAGVERGKAYLSSLPEAPQETALLDTPLHADFLNKWESLDEGSYYVTIDPDDNNPGSYTKRFTITSIGRITDPVTVKKKVVVELSKESFAKYAYFTNWEQMEDGTDIWFIGGEVIEGPLHSNDQINIYSSPTFMGFVTSTASSFNYYYGGPPYDNPDFQEGYQLGVEEINFDKFKDMAALEGLAQSGGIKLGSDSKVQLNSDGTFTHWGKTGGYWSNPDEIVWEDTTTVALPSNGVLYVEGNSLVSGTLSGELTLAVENDIYILEDVLYDTPPADPSCSDMLGLVAGEDVVVAKDSPSGGNLEIDATIMAFSGSFGVMNYDSIPVMGNLIVYGGIIQDRRGPVGTFGGGGRASGYLKEYHYDDRVIDDPPPYFPPTGEYQQDSWLEQPVVWE